jgi:CRP/FNR family transcriptional regulator, cyclic AMP receptor protein
MLDPKPAPAGPISAVAAPRSSFPGAVRRLPGNDRARAGEPRIMSLLDLDADLGRYLTPEDAETARREILVRVVRMARGPWSVDRLLHTDPGHLGLLVVDGLLSREVLSDDVASMELVGPGDLLRPWDDCADVGLLQAVIRWSVLADTRLAVLDRGMAQSLSRHADIYTALMERLSSRTRSLAVMQAIAQLNRVDRRLLTLLWHLADRWGRVRPDGVLVPLVLSHRALAQLVGARRPTVSTVIGELARDGELTRTAAGTWLLTGQPVGRPDETQRRFIAPRRAVVPVTVTSAAS